MKGAAWRAVACAMTAALCVCAPAAAAAPEPPMTFPGEARAASVGHDAWIVGARADAPRLARRFAARALGGGAYVVSPARARAFADALGDRLVYAQPDTPARPLQRAVPQDPLSVPPDDWRDLVADPALVPPPVTPDSPLIAVLDLQLDITHPEWQGGNTSTIDRYPVEDPHGTATTSVAVAPANGTGIVGVWPGGRAVNVPLPLEIRCSDSAEQINHAVGLGAAVINMSYGSEFPCFAEYVALQRAVARGVVPVAAAGNEFAEGNPPEFPASLPHVLTVAAVGPDLRSSPFSNTGPAIDLSAPGVNIMTAVPTAFDADGYARQDGTSFSAPMVSAAVAWVRAARPELSPDQVSQAIRLSAEDVGGDGWQEDTGFGVLSVGNALRLPAPPADPSEPNDDIIWVDGRGLGQPTKRIWSGGRDVRLRALLDQLEDPADVYRIRVPGRRTVRISANPFRRDDVALAVYRGTARRIGSRALKSSARRGRRTERITLRNTARRPRNYFVAVAVQGDRDLDAVYALRVG